MLITVVLGSFLTDKVSFCHQQIPVKRSRGMTEAIIRRRRDAGDRSSPQLIYNERQRNH
jgi:hypothetical protein